MGNSLIWTELARPGLWRYQHRVRRSCAWRKPGLGMLETECPNHLFPPFPPRPAGVAMKRKVSPSTKRPMVEDPAGCHATLPPRRLCPPVPMLRERSRRVKLSMFPCMFNASIRISTLRQMSAPCFCAASLRMSRYFPNAVPSPE